MAKKRIIKCTIPVKVQEKIVKRVEEFNKEYHYKRMVFSWK